MQSFADAADGGDSLVDLRCSVVVAHRDKVLLIHRTRGGSGETGETDWVLPGGRPYAHEGLAACARREVLEETGISVSPDRCAFVGEVIAPEGRRIAEVTFVVTLTGREPPEPVGEPGRRPAWVSFSDARALKLRPPVAGHLAGIVRPGASTAAYLGNLWRPEI